MNNQSFDPVARCSSTFARYRWLLILTILVTVASTSAAQAQNKTAPFKKQSFDYKKTALDLKEDSVKEQDGVKIRDVNYSSYSPERGRVKAFIVTPPGLGPFAGVLFFHWLGEPNGDRNEFLNEAIALAKRGTVSVLIQGYFPWAVEPINAETDRRRVVDETIEVRRALDLLLAQPGVDRKRIGYVGHDYGAMHGSVVAGVDKRVKTYVFVAAMGTFDDWSLKYWKGPRQSGADAYRTGMASVDPINFVSRAAPASLLFQFSKADKYISKETAEAYYNAASQPKQVLWYDTDHAMNLEAVRKDREDWLARELRLAK